MFCIFSLLIAKVHNYPLCLLFFNFSPHYLNFFFHPYSFYRSFFFPILFFNYNFSYVLFFISLLILLIFNFILNFFIVSVPESIPLGLIFYFSHFLFCWSFICLQFSHSILICVYDVFRFGLSTSDFLVFFFLCLFC